MNDSCRPYPRRCSATTLPPCTIATRSTYALIVTFANAQVCGTLYRLVSNIAVWYLSTRPVRLMQASKGWVASSRAAGFSNAKFTPMVAD